MKTCENYKAIQNQSCNPRPQTKGESSTLCIHRYLTGAVEVNHSKHTDSDWLVPVKWAHENLEIRGDDVFFPQPLLQLQQHRHAFQGLTAASAQKNRRGRQTAISTGWQQRALTITRIQSWHCHGLLSTKIISCVMMCPVLVMPYVNALIDQLFEPWFHIELTVRLRDHNFPIVAHPNCRPNTSSRRVFGQVISGEVSSIAFLNVKYLTSARRHLYSIPARAASAWSHPFLNDFGPSSIGQHSFAPRQALWCLHPHPSAKEKMAKDVQRCCPSFQADWRCWWESGVGHCPMTKGIWELEQWSNVAGSTFFSLKLNTRFKLQNMSKLASHTPVAFATIQHHMCYAPEVLNVWYSPRHAY